MLAASQRRTTRTRRTWGAISFCFGKTRVTWWGWHISAVTNPLFNRAWSLAVYSANGEQVITLSSSSFQQALKVTFDVRTMWYQWYWTADIQIWNPNEQLTDFLLSQGSTRSEE